MAKERNLINGMNERMVHLSSEILCCRFGHVDFLFVALVGVMCAALQHYVAGTTSFGLVLASVFGMGLYFLYRVYLPFHVYMRSELLIRFRYAFGSMIVVGTLCVMSSKACLRMLSSVNSDAVIAVAIILTFNLLIRFILGGNRLVLATIYLACGALCAWTFYGVLVLLIFHLVFFIIRMKLNAIAKETGFDESYNGEFGRQMDLVYDNLSIVSVCRMMVVVCFLIGFAGAIVCKISLEQIPISPIGMAKLIHVIYIDGPKTFLAGGGVMFLASLVMAFFAIYFLQLATDVYERLPNLMLLLYGILLIVSLSACYDFSDALLFRLKLQMNLISRVVLGAVLMLSGSVFVTELCCREADVGFVRCGLPRMALMNSRIVKHLGGLLFSIVVFGIVLAPIVMRIAAAGNDNRLIPIF